MKIIYIILGSLLAIFLLSGCVSLRFFDPQYYKFKYLAHKEGGTYIYDEQLEYEKNNSLLRKKYYTDFEKEISKIDSRILKAIDLKNIYTGDLKKTHLISHRVGFYYTDYGIFIGGDEGAGFWVDTSREIYDTNEDNDFILKDGKWVKVEN